MDATRPKSRAAGGGPVSSLLLEEARQPTIGEDLAVGLADRAVHDFVRLVRDALERLAAAWARSAGAAVDLEVGSEHRLGEPALALALLLEAVGEHVAHRVEQARPLVVVQLGQCGVGREMRAPEGVVGVAAADTSDRAL